MKPHEKLRKLAPLPVPCSNCEIGGSRRHPCIYNEILYNKTDVKCSCCEKCSAECSMDAADQLSYGFKDVSFDKVIENARKK